MTYRGQFGNTIDAGLTTCRSSYAYVALAMLLAIAGLVLICVLTRRYMIGVHAFA